MIRHIELVIEFDLTCGAIGWEDFENDTEESLKEDVEDYICDCPEELLSNVKIKRVWYEKVLKGESKNE